MKIFALLALLIFATAAFPQSANVIQLAPEDAARTQRAWDALQKAQNNWKSAQETIQLQYLDGQNCKPAPTWECSSLRKAGFENGFEFSKDFKYIVPKPSSGVATTCSSTYWGGCITLTPNVFTTTPTYSGHTMNQEGAVPSLPTNQDYLRRDTKSHHLVYSKKGGPELDIDEAYDQIGTTKAAGYQTPMPNMTQEQNWNNGVYIEHLDPAPKKTGKFDPVCSFEMSDGTSILDVCPVLAGRRSK